MKVDSLTDVIREIVKLQIKCRDELVMLEKVRHELFLQVLALKVIDKREGSRIRVAKMRAKKEEKG